MEISNKLSMPGRFSDNDAFIEPSLKRQRDYEIESGFSDEDGYDEGGGDSTGGEEGDRELAMEITIENDLRAAQEYMDKIRAITNLSVDEGVLEYGDKEVGGSLASKTMHQVQIKKSAGLHNLVKSSEELAKKSKNYDVYSDYFDKIMEHVGNRRRRRKTREPKKRGRRKGSKNKLTPDITKKLGDANLHYAAGNYVEAINVLNEVVRLAPNLGDPYHMLGLIYSAIGDNVKAMNFYILAACLNPKDPYLWKLLVARSMEMKNISLVMSFLSKAIAADPKDASLRFHRASLYVDLGSYQKAADAYDQILALYPENVEARTIAAKLYQKCGQVEKAITILENYIKEHSTKPDWNVIDLLATIQMENKAYGSTVQLIDCAHFSYGLEKKLPLHLTIKAAICEAHLGKFERAEILFMNLQREEADDHDQLLIEVADSFMNLGHYKSALKYYFILEGTIGSEKASTEFEYNQRMEKSTFHGQTNDKHASKMKTNTMGFLIMKIARCYLLLKENEKAIHFSYKALSMLEDNVDVRLTLACLLLDEGKDEETIAILSPPKVIETSSDTDTRKKPWWFNGRIKILLAKIYLGKGMKEEFVDAIFSSIQETLFIETVNRKARGVKKKLPKSVLYERAKLLDCQQDDNVWCGFRPFATSLELLKAARARKLLKKKAALKEEKKAAALASGLDWQSDDSDDEIQPRVFKEPPLPDLIKDEKHFQLIIDLCKALASLGRCWEALEVINHMLKLTSQTFSAEKKQELQSLGAQIAYNTTDATHGYDYVRHLVQSHPYSLGAWNCYYKVVSRLDCRFSKHAKFLHKMRVTYPDSVPPMLITGHQFSMISQYQAAASEYLQAYKLQPDNPLINLCVGTALINLALGLRIQNKHQCVVQGFAFLCNYQRICQNSQESLYNIARAYHHVGLVTLASMYYEKVLAMHVKDSPIPKLPNEHLGQPEKLNPGYCNLHREAAYNLHLIYKNSGALDLARQVLKDHCNP